MKLNSITRAAAGALAVLTIGVVAYSIGHNAGYESGSNEGHAYCYTNGYNDGRL